MIIVIIILIILIYLRINSASIKGSVGEKNVNKILDSIPDSKVLKDIMIRNEKGTSQIDHILINSKGIFVIETKNYDGWIFGDEKSQYWTQTIYKKKSKFYNPIRQNYGHIKAVEECLSLKKDVLKSVIVFSNRCKFKKLTANTPVIKINKLKQFLNSYRSNVILTTAEINYFYMMLEKNNIIDKNKRKIHVKNIKENKG